MGDAQVRQASFQNLIRRALRDHYAAVMAEPIPQRWVDLLNRLAEEERSARQAPAKRDRGFGHSMS
jgi:Anti-sigma factor NepR